MGVKERFLAVLDTFGYPVYLQGTMADDEEYPDTFFTYFNNYADGADFYDNEETAIIWDFDLNVYSNDVTVVNTVLMDAKRALKADGFIVSGAGYDVMSDQKSHTGRGINVMYIERGLE